MKALDKEKQAQKYLLTNFQKKFLKVPSKKIDKILFINSIILKFRHSFNYYLILFKKIKKLKLFT